MNIEVKFLEIVGIFKSDQNMQTAIDDLGLEHFKRQDISVIGNERAMKEEFSKPVEDPKNIVDNSSAPRGVNITPQEKGVGAGAIISANILIGAMVSWIILNETKPLIHVIPTVIIGCIGGGVFGYLLVKLISYINKRNLQKQIDKGGLVLWVKVIDKEKEEIARRIFKKNMARNIHLIKSSSQ